MSHVSSMIIRSGSVLLLGMSLVACAGSGGATLSTVGNAVGDPIAGGVDRARYGEGQQPAATGAPQAPGDGVGAVVDDAKIIRTGTIEIEVTDVPKALLAARDGIRAMGGYIGASQTANTDDRPTASVTYRIPADRWEDALDLLRGLNGLTSKVLDEKTDAIEVTGAVIDLEARIRNLRASETALQEIAAGATKVSDVLEVQAQLTAVRGQIEQLSAQLGDLNDRASFATLTVSYRLPVVAVEIARKGFEPGTVVDEASASLVDILQALTTAGIWFAIVWLPILLGLGIIVAVVTVVVRRLGWVGRRNRGDLPLPG
jgi:uncharacterized protein DUF4349